MLNFVGANYLLHSVVVGVQLHAARGADSDVSGAS